MGEFINFLEKFNQELEKSAWFRGAKVVLGFYLVIMAVIVIGILYRIGKLYWTILMTGQEFPVVKRKLQARWEKTEKRLESPDANQWKAAILEAAQMLDEVLKIIGYKGQTLGERLNEMLPEQLENLEEVKAANEVKNNIVKDERYILSREEAQQVFSAFKKALRLFEAIE